MLETMILDTPNKSFQIGPDNSKIDKYVQYPSDE